MVGDSGGRLQPAAEKVRLQSEPPATAFLTKQCIAHFQKQLARRNKAVAKLLKTDAVLGREYELLLSTPGIGPVTAIAILAEPPPPGSFERVRDAAARAGVTPALRDHLVIRRLAAVRPG